MPVEHSRVERLRMSGVALTSAARSGWMRPRLTRVSPCSPSGAALAERRGRVFLSDGDRPLTLRVRKAASGPFRQRCARRPRRDGLTQTELGGNDWHTGGGSMMLMHAGRSLFPLGTRSGSHWSRNSRRICNWLALRAGQCRVFAPMTVGTAAQPSEQVQDERKQDGASRHDGRACQARPMKRRAVVLGAVAGLMPGLAAGARAAKLPDPVPEPFLVLRHVQTGEVLSSRFERWERLDPAQARRLEWFMRDWREGRSMPVDPDLLRFLAHIRHAAVLEGHEGEILLHSGFRTRKTNEMLRRAGIRAAANSLHLRAKAADISMPGLRPSRLARAARRTGLGGVGLYSGFVHVDTGR